MLVGGPYEKTRSDDEVVLHLAEQLRCIDSTVTRKEWEAELRDPRTVTNAMFFDTPRWRENAKSVYPVMSVRDYFLSAKGVHAKVYEESVHTKAVIFSADQPPHVVPLVEFSFGRDNAGRWWLVSIPNCG
jgi:hypothetical protein